MGIFLKSFENSGKNHEFVKKKTHVHSFASNDSIFNQNKRTQTLLYLIRYESWKSNILDVGFFFNKVFEVEFLFFWKSKKTYFETLFLWKNVTNIILFFKKK